MTRFLKQNYALLVGILLPIALIAVFFASGKVRTANVADPQYDAVFAVDYSERAANNRYRIGLDAGKLYIRIRQRSDQAAKGFFRDPTLYLLDHKTRYARKIDIDFGSIVDGKVSDPDLDALNRQRIIDNPESPDGYRFEYLRRGGRGLFSEIFGRRRRGRSNYGLVKEGRQIEITGPEPIWNAHFIGWIEK